MRRVKKMSESKEDIIITRITQDMPEEDGWWLIQYIDEDGWMGTESQLILTPKMMRLLVKRLKEAGF